MERILLVGTEEVSRAGHNISSAAEEMKLAASNIESALLNHQQFLDRWLEQYQAITERGPDHAAR